MNGEHELDVMTQLGQIEQELQAQRSQLLTEVADVDAGLRRIAAALGTKLSEPDAVPLRTVPRKRRSTAKRGTAKRSTAKRSTGRKNAAKRSTAKRSTANGHGNGDLTAKILTVVSKAKTPITATVVAKRANILDATARRHLSGLIQQGRIREAGKTRGPGRAAQLYAVK